MHDDLLNLSLFSPLQFIETSVLGVTVNAMFRTNKVQIHLIYKHECIFTDMIKLIINFYLDFSINTQRKHIFCEPNFVRHYFAINQRKKSFAATNFRDQDVDFRQNTSNIPETFNDSLRESIRDAEGLANLAKISCTRICLFNVIRHTFDPQKDLKSLIFLQHISRRYL